MAQIHYFLRNILIINKVKNNPYTGLSELTDYVEQSMTLRGIENVGISRRTILRDIQNIQTEFGIDIQYSRARNGYFIEPAVLQMDVEQFLDSFDVFTALNIDESIPGFVFAEKRRPRGTQHLFTLIHAIKNVLRIRFSYGKFQGEALSERCLEPYALKECRGRWYVVGRIAGQTDMKSYGLDRISNLVLTEETFQKDMSVDIAEKFRNSYGIYSSDEYPVEEVVLSFDAEDGRYLKSLPLHHSQEIISDTAEEFIIKLRLKITPDFVMEIMSRSWSLKIIEPLILREQACKIWQDALKRNEIR
ncbi:MAG: WYL domain-containing protein [Prevotellaceae bacterium]|jgi:predicted DNA-binding transcriptional regulator YafY|nr:WYL domain-containing protein [Prevotellaceae bacterium]